MQRTIGCSTPESKLVENPTVDDPTGNSSLKSSGSVKQEVNKAQCASFDILYSPLQDLSIICGDYTIPVNKREQ